MGIKFTFRPKITIKTTLLSCPEFYQKKSIAARPSKKQGRSGISHEPPERLPKQQRYFFAKKTKLRLYCFEVENSTKKRKFDPLHDFKKNRGVVLPPQACRFFKVPEVSLNFHWIPFGHSALLCSKSELNPHRRGHLPGGARVWSTFWAPPGGGGVSYYRD